MGVKWVFDLFESLECTDEIVYLPVSPMLSRFPNALVIVLLFILLAGLLCYVLPMGQYERRQDPATGRAVVVAGSYHAIDAGRIAPFQLLVDIPRGITSGAEVVVLIFLVGGFFYIVDKSGALREGIVALAHLVHGREGLALWVVGLVFAIGGALEGLQEEIIPVIPVLLILTQKLGFNRFVTIAISYGAATVGAMFSPLNPFGAVIAQKLAEVPFLEGSTLRMIAFGVGFSLWMYLVVRYAKANAIVPATNSEHEKTTGSSLHWRHQLILTMAALTFAILIIGLMAWGWGFNEMSAEFFLSGLLIGLVGGMGLNGTCLAYVEGFREMTFAAMIIGMSHSISLVLTDGHIMDTIIYGLFTPLQYLPAQVSALGMMLAQAGLHVVVPSYSGQAVLTIPILIPVSDLLGLSRDVCVLAFQYGAVVMDMVIPTNGALMAVIALAGIQYNEWFSFIWKRILLLMAFGGAIILLAIASGF